MTEEEWLESTDLSPMFHGLLRCEISRVNERKLKLLACHCYRRVWASLMDEVCREAVIVAERYADGLADANHLADAKLAVMRAFETAVEKGMADRAFSTSMPSHSKYFLTGSQSHLSRAFYAAIDLCTVEASFTPFVPSPPYMPPEAYRSIAAVSAAKCAATEAAALDVGPSESLDIDLEEWARAYKCEQRKQAAFLRDIFGNPFRPVAFSPEWRTSTAVAIAQQMYESRDFSPMPILADALEDAGCDNADILEHCRDLKATHARGCWVVDEVLGKQ